MIYRVTLFFNILFFCSCSTPPNYRIIATVDGHEIHEEELRFELSNERTPVYSYFAEKLQLGEEPLNWTKDYNGEIPINILKERALENAVVIKVLQIYMQKYDVQKDIAYNDFIQEYHKTYKTRAESVRKEEVVYGPPTFSEEQYYTYVFSNNLIRLKYMLYKNEVTTVDSYQDWLNDVIRHSVVVVNNKYLEKLEF